MAKKKEAVRKVAGKATEKRGRGRPPKYEGGTINVSARLPIDVAEWIEASGMSRADAIAAAVRSLPEYTKWRAKHPAK